MTATGSWGCLSATFLQSTPAARSALKINYAVQLIVNPALKAQYPSKTFEVRQVVGIDTSELRAARTGIRGGNDIVWVGRAANYAAKLTELKLAERTWVTERLHNHLLEDVKLGGSNKEKYVEALDGPKWGTSAFTVLLGGGRSDSHGHAPSKFRIASSLPRYANCPVETGATSPTEIRHSLLDRLRPGQRGGAYAVGGVYCLFSGDSGRVCVLRRICHVSRSRQR